jgi:hypothetical protein
LPSLQLGDGPPTHVPPLQVSFVVQALPSLQAVPFGLTLSAGQAALVPVQFSVTSHSPAASRHAVVEGAKLSGGQLLLTPSHVSARSQTPAAVRHTVPAGIFASGGHAVLVPVHLSATSQAPAEGRHSVPALPAGFWQPTPGSHESVVHGLPSLQLGGTPDWQVPTLAGGMMRHVSGPSHAS